MNDVQVSHFGAPLWASDGAIYWPLVSDTGMTKSTDLGKTWTKIVGSGAIVGSRLSSFPTAASLRSAPITWCDPRMAVRPGSPSSIRFPSNRWGRRLAHLLERDQDLLS